MSTLLDEYRALQKEIHVLVFAMAVGRFLKMQGIGDQKTATTNRIFNYLRLHQTDLDWADFISSYNRILKHREPHHSAQLMAWSGVPVTDFKEWYEMITGKANAAIVKDPTSDTEINGSPTERALSLIRTYIGTCLRPAYLAGQIPLSDDGAQQGYYKSKILQKLRKAPASSFGALSMEGLCHAAADHFLGERQKIENVFAELKFKLTDTVINPPQLGYARHESPQELMSCLKRKPILWKSLEKFMTQTNERWPILIAKIKETGADDPESLREFANIHRQFIALFKSLEDA